MRAIKRKGREKEPKREKGERKNRGSGDRDTDLKCHTAGLQDGRRSYKPRNAERR